LLIAACAGGSDAVVEVETVDGEETVETEETVDGEETVDSGETTETVSETTVTDTPADTDDTPAPVDSVDTPGDTDALAGTDPAVDSLDSVVRADTDLPANNDTAPVETVEDSTVSETTVHIDSDSDSESDINLETWMDSGTPDSDESDAAPTETYTLQDTAPAETVGTSETPTAEDSDTDLSDSESPSGQDSPTAPDSTSEPDPAVEPRWPPVRSLPTEERVPTCSFAPGRVIAYSDRFRSLRVASLDGGPFSMTGDFRFGSESRVHLQVGDHFSHLDYFAELPLDGVADLEQTAAPLANSSPSGPLFTFPHRLADLENNGGVEVVALVERVVGVSDLSIRGYRVEQPDFDIAEFEWEAFSDPQWGGILRGARIDFNADGEVDFVFLVGGPGGVYDFRFVPGPLPPGLVDVERLKGAELNGDFAYSFEIGKFNDDEIDDLVAKKYNTLGGEVDIWFGPFEGVVDSRNPDVVISSTEYEGEDPALFRYFVFGGVVNLGDIDGDGSDDLAIGAPDDSNGTFPGTGAAFIFKGPFSAGLRLDDRDADITVRWPTSEALTGGQVLALGDVNGDGLSDFIVDAPYARPTDAVDLLAVGFPSAPGCSAEDTFRPEDTSEPCDTAGRKPNDPSGIDYTGAMMVFSNPPDGELGPSDALFSLRAHDPRFSAGLYGFGPVGDQDGDGLTDIAYSFQDRAGHGLVYVVHPCADFGTRTVIDLIDTVDTAPTYDPPPTCELDPTEHVIDASTRTVSWLRQGTSDTSAVWHTVTGPLLGFATTGIPGGGFVQFAPPPIAGVQEAWMTTSAYILADDAPGTLGALLGRHAYDLDHNGEDDVLLSADLTDAGARFDCLGFAPFVGERAINTPDWVLSDPARSCLDALPADLNGDGVPDLLLTLGDADGTVTGWGWVAGPILPGTTQILPLPADQAPEDVASADWNGDGVADLAAVVAGEGKGGEVRVWWGPVIGNFDAPDVTLRSTERRRVGNGDTVMHRLVAPGDLNGDGAADLVVGASDDDLRGADGQLTTDGLGAAYVFWGPLVSGTDADAVATIRWTADGAHTGADVLAPGDVDGDGRPDLVVTAPGALDANGAQTGAVMVFANPVGELGPSGASLVLRGEAGAPVAQIGVGTPGDLDGDGLSDLVVGVDDPVAPTSRVVWGCGDWGR
jgi:hypothetical protein